MVVVGGTVVVVGGTVVVVGGTVVVVVTASVVVVCRVGGVVVVASPEPPHAATTRRTRGRSISRRIGPTVQLRPRTRHRMRDSFAATSPLAVQPASSDLGGFMDSPQPASRPRWAHKACRGDPRPAESGSILVDQKMGAMSRVPARRSFLAWTSQAITRDGGLQMAEFTSTFEMKPDLERYRSWGSCPDCSVG